MRRSNYAYVHLARRERPYAQHLLVLQRSKQLGLSGQGHVPDLVEEDHASVGMLEKTHLVVGSPGERALHVTEELALKKSLDHGRTVQHHVIAPANGTELVQCASHQILACAGLSSNEHRA